MIKSLLSASALALITVAASAADGPLVINEWLETKLDDPSIALIEVSVNPGVFKRGHMPFATNLAWHTDLVDPVHSDIASREQLEGLLREAGVNEDNTVVLYGDTKNWLAAWGAWVLDVYGVEDVKLLDSGRRLWEAEGRQLASSPTPTAPGDITLAEADPTLRA